MRILQLFIFGAPLWCTMFCPDIAEQFRTVRLLPFVLINAAVHLCNWLIRDHVLPF